MPSIAPGVIHVATSKNTNSFLVDGDDGLTLVDTGMAKTVGVLLRAVEDIGRKPGDIKRIVLTHAHPDHVAASPELRKQTGARVLIHEADAPWLSGGRVPAEGRSGWAARTFDRFSVAHWTPFQADQTVEDDELIDGSGLRVIHTPGHSPGHIVLLHEATRTVLVGDAIFNNKQLGLGLATFSADPGARAASVTRIPADVTAVGFGHGAPLSEADTDAFRAFLDNQGEK